jgi:voltage-gated potassium channel
METSGTKWYLRLLPIVAAILGILALGTAGYMFLEGWSLLDALYMTVITITTVGYREVHPLSDAGKIFTIVLLLVGVATLFAAIAVVGEMAVQTEITRFFTGGGMREKIEKLSGHFLVCGFGRVGQQVAAEFSRHKVPFVVVDKNREVLALCKERGYLYIDGDASRDEVLLNAGVKRAKGLVACADSDEANVYVILSARELNPDLYIVARANYYESEAKLRRAGANRVISPYAIGGRRMAMMAIKPLVVDALDTVMYAGPLAMALEELEVADGSPLANLTVEQARHRQARGLTILAIQKRDKGLIVHPSGDTLIEPGDRLVVLGTPQQLEEVERV